MTTNIIIDSLSQLKINQQENFQQLSSFTANKVA